MPVDRYSTQQITPEDETAVLDALRSPYLTQGPYVERFEQAIAEYVGAKYAVAVSSGTAALHLAYLASGVRSVVTSPLSFVATANAALLAGASVGFVDVDAATGNAELHPDSFLDQHWAYVPVHFAGRAAAIPDLSNAGREAVVIEDACHALGAMDFDGCSRVGSCAHSLATVFSFHPVKPICTGEGGAITTNDEGLAERLRSLRSHGRDADGRMHALGPNYRMGEIQAALGLSQLRRCDEMRLRRRDLVREYKSALRGRRLGDVLAPPDSKESAWHLYAVRIGGHHRNTVRHTLGICQIGVQVHYEPIIPLQPYWRARFGYEPGEFPSAEAWADEELSLPLHAAMTDRDVAIVCDALAEALR